MRWWRVIWTDGLRGFARPWLLLTEMWGRQPSCLLRGRTVPGLLRTGDGGKTWTSAVLDGTDITSNGTSTHGEIDAWRKNSGHIDNIWFEDARCGYAEASYTSGRERKTILLVTNDGGLHFVPQTGGNAARALIQNGAEEGEKTA